jgi:hypothetical protein
MRFFLGGIVFYGKACIAAYYIHQYTMSCLKRPGIGLTHFTQYDSHQI